LDIFSSINPKEISGIQRDFSKFATNFLTMIKQFLARQMVRRTKNRLFPVEYLEQKHVDLSQPFPNDSSFFYGGDKAGNAFITRMAFRGPDRPHEYWFDFYLKGKGFYGIHKDPGAEGEGFRLGNLCWEPVEVGKKWKISYEGDVQDKDGKNHSCKTEFIFTGENAVYDFATSSDQKSIARAIASEPWNKDFFFKLKDTHQTHYEQTGNITGYFMLDGEKFNVDFRASRDHSFGSRNWLTWDRHYWITGLSDSGYHWTVTTIRFDFLGRLTAGFVIGPDGVADAIIECTNLEAISKEKLMPDHGIVELIMRSGKKHTLEFFRNGHFPYVMDEKYLMYEAIGTYKFDGSDGLGMVEFGFHSDKYKV
jgi:hypothetical protein